MVKASQMVLAYVKAPVSSADTEITIRWLNDIYGTQAVMQGTTMYGTIEPRSSSNQEIISFTNIVVVDSNTVRLTGCTRWLKAQDSETGTARDHGANVEFILSNNPQFYDTFAALDEAETITAEWTFSVSPTVPTPDSALEVVNKAYADSLAVLGSPDASITQKGISRLSASPTTTIGTFTVTIASPAVFTFTSHGLTENDSVQFTTTGALPTGLVASTTYYVIAAGLTANTFRVSATYGGSAVNTTGSQSGVHTLFKTTPVAVGVNDTKMLTQDENNAAVGAGGSPSSTNLFETQYDTSNGSTKTATTISFAAGTKTIADSGNGFVTAGFKQGTQITVTGSASNNATYTIVSVVAGAIVVAETLVNESAGASVVITTVRANKILRLDLSGSLPAINGVLVLSSIFGTGSDGAVTFNGSSTVLWLIPSGNTYTMTRDIHCTDITINVWVTILPAGYRIYATWTTTNNGTISNNGGSGGNAVNSSASTIGAAGAAGVAATAWVTVFGTAQAGIIWAQWRATVGNGIDSATSASTTNSVCWVGWVGGSWSSTNDNNGWGLKTGGTWSTAGSATTSGTDWIKDFITATTFYTIAWVIKNGTGGTGGGWGALSADWAIGTDRSGSGGWGGWAGGVVYIATKTLAGNGSSTANGGNGGNGGNGYHGTGATNTATGGWGGWAGGAGGAVIVITQTTTNPNTINVSGGTGGTGWTSATNGTWTATASATGATGTTWQSVYFVI